MNEVSINKTWHKFLWIKWQQSWNVYQIKNRRWVCETLTKNISSKRLTLHKTLSKSENVFVTHMRTKRINFVDYLFSRDVSTMSSSSCICDYSRQTLKHALIFCVNEAANKQRVFQDDETTNLRKLLNMKRD
jgi:hypothetical protein